MNPQVDVYFIDGCMRCSFGGTPACKVHKWDRELAFLRQLANESALEEELKWGCPVYTLNGKNVLMIGAFKEYCCLSFLKGVLINDTENLLVFAGENSQSAKLLKFTDFDQVVDATDKIIEYINQAIDIEKSGQKVELKTIDAYDMPDELSQALELDNELRDGFYALTPGRQRSYIIHISQAKQSATRISRIENCKPKILRGRGFNEYE
jgi:uncharacterized protein YdeI (YjbR/CyaY-like superfamily)